MPNFKDKIKSKKFEFTAPLEELFLNLMKKVRYWKFQFPGLNLIFDSFHFLLMAQESLTIIYILHEDTFSNNIFQQSYCQNTKIL